MWSRTNREHQRVKSPPIDEQMLQNCFEILSRKSGNYSDFSSGVSLSSALANHRNESLWISNCVWCRTLLLVSAIFSTFNWTVSDKETFESSPQALLSEDSQDDTQWPPELILLREKLTAKSQLEIAQLNRRHEEEVRSFALSIENISSLLMIFRVAFLIAKLTTGRYVQCSFLACNVMILW